MPQATWYLEPGDPQMWVLHKMFLSNISKTGVIHLNVWGNEFFWFQCGRLEMLREQNWRLIPFCLLNDHNLFISLLPWTARIWYWRRISFVFHTHEERTESWGPFYLAPKRDFGDPPKRAPVLFAFSGTPRLHTFWGSVLVFLLIFPVNYLLFFAAKKISFWISIHFEFAALRNRSCHWTVELLRDDLHLACQHVVCWRRGKFLVCCKKAKFPVSKVFIYVQNEW